MFKWYIIYPGRWNTLCTLILDLKDGTMVKQKQESPFRGFWGIWTKISEKVQTSTLFGYLMLFVEKLWKPGYSTLHGFDLYMELECDPKYRKRNIMNFIRPWRISWHMNFIRPPWNHIEQIINRLLDVNVVALFSSRAAPPNEVGRPFGIQRPKYIIP